MKRLLISGLVGILLVQGLSAASTLSDFGTQQKEATASLRYPDFSDIINITLPAECHVLNATMDLSTIAPDNEFPAGPVNMSVLLNNTVLYSFNGSAYGGFGYQSMFKDGNKTVRSDFGINGGTANTTIRLPKSATILSASMNITGNGPDKIVEKWSRNGSTEERFWILDKAGDVNNDRYDDFVVGAFSNSAKARYAGAAYLFLGGPILDTVEDAVFFGNASWDLFGASLAGLGDINGDSYDDIAICAYYDDIGYTDAGATYIYFGGDPMDNVSDLFFSGNETISGIGGRLTGNSDLNGDGYSDLIMGSSSGQVGEALEILVYYGGKTINTTPDIIFTTTDRDSWFGILPRETPDLNNDGYDDLVIGQCNYKIGDEYYGRAYLYFGGKDMDNISDLTFEGQVENEHFGDPLSSAGDVNGDGYEDLVIGTSPTMTDPNITGAAYLYYGGESMDAEPDIIIKGDCPSDWFGQILSSAGDLNLDGFDDVMVSAPGNETNGPFSGAVYIYYGDQEMDTRPDLKIFGNPGDMIGAPISNAGDLDRDGRCDILVGAGINNTTWDGGVRAYSVASGLFNSSLRIDSNEIWTNEMYFNGTNKTADFSRIINNILENAGVSFKDEYENSFVDIPINMSGEREGSMTLGNLSIVYSYTMQTNDFSAQLNKYIIEHKNEQDANGNITVPLNLISQSPGKVKFNDLEIIIDEAPELPLSIPDMSMNEDTTEPDLVDLQHYFKDDYEQAKELGYKIVSFTNETKVNVNLIGNRYLSIDTLNGTQNDNWTGTVDIVVKCSDRWNSMTESNMFTVTVQNVPDPPVFMSTPKANGTAGVQYQYQVMAIDGDMDPITYSLSDKPSDMTIDAKSGLIAWMPKAGGDYPVSINATDGQFNVFQNFSITVPNQYPNVTSSPNTTAITTVHYGYLVKASDADGDNLTYSLVSEIPGMTIDAAKGNVSWTPQTSGDYTVKIRVMDGKGGEALQEFLIHVYEKVEPKMEFVSLPEKAKVEGTVNVSIGITNGSLNVVNVQYRLDSGEWINVSGTEMMEFSLDTTTLKNGAHKLEIRVYDGQDYTEVATRTFTVNNPVTKTEKPFPTMIVVVIIGLAVVAGALLLWKGKHPPDEEE